jgi:hypothetical protein
MRRITVLIALLALGGALPAQAAPLDRAQVPANATWLVQIDVDAMRESKVVEAFFKECGRDGGLFDAWFDRIERRCGIDPRSDLHGVTIFGERIAPRDTVMIVHSQVDKDRLLALARSARDHRTEKHGDHEIHTWTDRGGPGPEHQAAGAFFEKDKLVIAGSVERLNEALDVLDGKGDTLAKSDKPLAAKVPAGAMIVVRTGAIEAKDMPFRNPVLETIEEIDLVRGEHDGQHFGTMKVRADSSVNAQRMKDVLEGVMAMVSLQLRDKDKVVDLMKKTEVKVEGDTLHVNFSQPAERVAAAIPQLCEGLMPRSRADIRRDRGDRDPPRREQERRDQRDERRQQRRSIEL